MKFNSQWNLGSMRQRWPAASIVPESFEHRSQVDFQGYVCCSKHLKHISWDISQIVLVETALCENRFNALWNFWVFWMRSGIYHGLVDFAAILYKPGIMHARLLSTRVDIYVSGHQSMLCICRVSLRVINKD